MTDLNNYANRTPGAASSVGVGGEKPGTCASCNAGSTSMSDSDGDCYDFQRIPLFEPIPADESPPAEGRDFAIEVDHRGDWFWPKSMFLEARNVDGSVNHFAYVRAYQIDEDRQDCISSTNPRGIPVHVYSVQGGCCDGLRVCIRPFENKKEREFLKIHVRVFGGSAGVLQGYMRGRCQTCGYEKHCRVDKAEPAKPAKPAKPG